MKKQKIVLGNSTLATYPEGGGHWSVFLQYLLGLQSLGHQVILMECFISLGDKKADEHRIDFFFKRLNEYGFKDKAVIISFPQESMSQDIETANCYGRSLSAIKDLISQADLLWNFCASIRQPLLGLFDHRVFIDLDPGHLQVAALNCSFDLNDHHSYLTVGSKMEDEDCEVPLLNIGWKSFRPFVFLPLWPVAAKQNAAKHFTSITHWNWDELELNGRRLSLSKREAYLRYIDLPKNVGKPFELATYFDTNDKTGDRELLKANGWNIVNPWEIASSPQLYQKYISGSMGEILCPKPIFRELKTGWFSDRSVCYLASGRPVLAEDTGFSDHLPSGNGLFRFSNMEGAVEAVKEICNNYKHHMKTARQLAEEIFNSDVCLNKMLESCI